MLYLLLKLEVGKKTHHPRLGRKLPNWNMFCAYISGNSNGYDNGNGNGSGNGSGNGNGCGNGNGNHDSGDRRTNTSSSLRTGIS